MRLTVMGRLDNTRPSHDARPRRPRGLPHPAAAALGVFLFGFGALLIYWLAGDWPTDHGLFTYRAATIGDAILLPTIVGILVAALRLDTLCVGNNRPLERRAARVGALLGGLVGCGLQVAWLADAEPTTNWTLPEAHTFNAPGWWHAAFFVAVLAVISALSLTTTVRVRAARREGNEAVAELARSPWLVVLVTALALFEVLVAVDGALVGDGAVTAVTGVPLAVGALLVAALMLVAFGPDREVVYSAGLGVAIAVGCGALATVGLPVSPKVALVASWCGAATGVALANPLVANRRHRWLRATAAIALLLGGVAVAFETAVDHPGTAALAVGAGAALAFAFGVPSVQDEDEPGLVIFATAYMLGLLVAAAWIDAQPVDQARAAITIAAATTLLDAIAITLIRDRFNGFVKDVQKQRHEEAGDSLRGPQAWLLLLGLAFTTLPALILLLVVATDGLGLDDPAGGAAAGLVAVGLAAGVAGALGLSALLLVRRPPRRLDPGELGDADDDRLNWPTAPAFPAVVLVTVAAAALTGTLLGLLTGPLHYLGFAAFAAVGMASLTAEDTINSPIRLQLAKPTVSARLMSGASALTTGSGVLWLITNGLWDGEEPASISGCVVACALALLGPAFVAIVAGVVNAQALTSPYITEQAAWFNAIVQPLMYSAVAALAFAVPVCVVGRVEASGVENAGLATLAAVGFLPAVLGVFLWILKNNNQHRLNELSKCPKRVEDEAIRRGVSIDKFNSRRGDILSWHAVFVNVVTGALVVSGLAWGYYVAALT